MGREGEGATVFPLREKIIKLHLVGYHTATTSSTVEPLDTPKQFRLEWVTGSGCSQERFLDSFFYMSHMTCIFLHDRLFYNTGKFCTFLAVTRHDKT